MQKSILQTAIQGKLVEQRPEEGTGEDLFHQIQAEKQALIKAGKIKKEKPLPEITEDEILFDIPDTWKWIRLGSVIDMLSGFAFKSTDFKKEGKYRLLRGINLSVGNTRWDDTVYVDEMPEKCISFQILKGDVLIGLDRPWISEGIRVAIYDDDGDTYLVQRVLRIRETAAITKEYIALLLRSNLFRDAVEGETTGISVPHISPGQVGSVVVPLPPLAEQKRIVAKLEEILPLCERLK
jgi:type I restriction enzyme S subunit